MIRSVTIRNLRGIRECTLRDLTDVNILIGKNGAGKSTVLEALYVASAWPQPYDILRGVEGKRVNKLDYVVWRRGGRGSWSSAREVLWYNMDTSKDVEIKLCFEKGKCLTFHMFSVTADPELSIWLEIPRDLIEKKLVVTPEYKFYNLTRDVLASLKVIRSLQWRLTYKPSERFKRAFEQLLGKEVRFLNKLVFIDYKVLTNPTIVEKNVWSRLLPRRLDKLVLDVIRDEYERDVEDLTYMPIMGDYVLAVKLPTTTIRIDDLGDGARIAVLLASIMAVIEDAPVLIEEPEAHQHPGGLKAVLGFMFRIAKSRRLQLFITTHSIELINIAMRLCEELGLNLRVYFLERGGDGRVDVRVLEVIDVDVLQKLGLDPRMIYVI